jgi:hypothetical protein
VAAPHDPDQLLALALARMRGEHSKLVRAQEEVLAAARQARARAARTREGLDEQRERRATTIDESRKLHARLRRGRPAPEDESADKPDL